MKQRCPACRMGGYTQTKAADGRPLFTCTQCDHTWTQGKAGGEFAAREAESPGQKEAS